MGGMKRMSQKTNIVWSVLLFVFLMTLSGLCQHETESEFHHRLHKTGWHYPWFGPDAQSSDRGYLWQKAYRGECIYLDDRVLAIVIDDYEDTRYFTYTEESQFIPSASSLRVGSKVEIRCDTRHRIRSLKTLPFHTWLKFQRVDKTWKSGHSTGHEEEHKH